MSRARLEMAAEDVWTKIVVEDRGKGLPAERNKRGIGLVAMRERAELVGGKIVWMAGPNGGTTVRLEIPQEQLN